MSAQPTLHTGQGQPQPQLRPGSVHLSRVGLGNCGAGAAVDIVLGFGRGRGASLWAWLQCWATTCWLPQPPHQFSTLREKGLPCPFMVGWHLGPTLPLKAQPCSPPHSSGPSGGLLATGGSLWAAGRTGQARKATCWWAGRGHPRALPGAGCSAWPPPGAV